MQHTHVGVTVLQYWNMYCAALISVLYVLLLHVLYVMYVLYRNKYCVTVLLYPVYLTYTCIPDFRSLCTRMHGCGSRCYGYRPAPLSHKLSPSSKHHRQLVRPAC